LLRARGVTVAVVVDAIAPSNSAVGGHVILKGNAEYGVRGVGWLGQATGDGGASFDPQRVLNDLENTVLHADGSAVVRVADVATTALGTQFRRGVLEKDGSDVS